MLVCLTHITCLLCWCAMAHLNKTLHDGDVFLKTLEWKHNKKVKIALIALIQTCPI